MNYKYMNLNTFLENAIWIFLKKLDIKIKQWPSHLDKEPRGDSSY